MEVNKLNQQLEEKNTEAEKNIEIVKKEEELERENEREALQLQNDAEAELAKALPGKLGVAKE